jgi:mono/diheme cytochrome c family protein
MRAGMGRLWLACAASILFVIGCNAIPIEQAAPLVDRLTVGDDHITQLEAGRAIYVTRCTHCHSVKPVYAYEAEQWIKSIMPRMAKRAKLNAVETDNVLAYVLTARQLRPPGGYQNVHEEY